VTLKLEVWVTQGHQKCHRSIAWVWFPIWLLQRLRSYLSPLPRYTDLLAKNHPIITPCVCCPRYRWSLSELSNNHRWWKTRMMGLSGGKNILMKLLAILIQSTHVRHRQADMPQHTPALA